MNSSRLVVSPAGGSKKLYSRVEDAPLNLVDTSVIPSPEEMEAGLQKLQSGANRGSKGKA
jgi:hypothetical protein